MEEKTDVVIVGAGIAGLALALELQKRSVSTLLVDRRKGPDSVPRGITFQPNGLGALEQIGILDRVQQMGSSERILEVRDWDHNLLLEADYSVLDHSQNASIVVGADGPQSRVRSMIGATARTRKYADSFLVGMVGPVKELKDRARQYQAPGKMLGIMPAGPDACYFFYCVGERKFDDLKRQGVEQFRGEVTEAAPELEQAFGGVEAWTRIGYFTPSFIKVDPWVGNGVTLLGDAAHTFHPHAGQGVNLSLQDALALAEVIEDATKAGDTSAKRLATYQTSRKMFADVIGQHAHYTATYALSNNRLVKWLNKRALRKMNKDRTLMKRALEITAGIFTEKPGLIEQARMGGILP